jgi:hypothetical protein
MDMQHAYVTSLKSVEENYQFRIYFYIIQRFNELTSLRIALSIEDFGHQNYFEAVTVFTCIFISKTYKSKPVVSLFQKQ